MQFGGPSQTDSVSRQSRRHKTRHAVAGEPAEVEYLVLSILGDVNLGLNRRGRLGVVVTELAVGETLDLHPRRMQWDKLAHAALPATLDVCESITPEQKPALEEFPELKARHPRIGLVAQQFVQMLLFGDFFAAAGEPAIDVHWHRRQRFGEDSDAA